MDSSNLVEKLERRIIKDFMDIFLLAELKNGSLSGYDVIRLVQKRYDILVSSGTVYSLLYSLERNGWIRGVWNHRKRTYELAEKGKRDVKVILKVNEEVQNFLRRISLVNATVNS